MNSATDERPTIRVGVLGAARIVKNALLTPARDVQGIEVVAIAARDPQRAAEFARKHGLGRIHTTYEALLADPEIDVVYLPLPVALHAEWTIAAVQAGKHVLCEKPFTSNADAAERVAAETASSNRVVMEAYHSHYHPLYGRLREIIGSGELGRITAARASFCVPIRPGNDIRWNLALGGGGLLDVGYYPVRALSELFGAATHVDSARAWLRGAIDRRMDASLRFTGDIDGTVRSSLWSSRLLAMSLQVRGEDGLMRVSFPYSPQRGARIHVSGIRGRRTERTDRRSSYLFQLTAFRDAVTDRAPFATDATAAAEHLRTLDAIYRRAGMQPRP